MTDDEKHLNLLSTFHYVASGLTALFSCIFIVHLVMGVAVLSGAIKGPPGFVAVIFVIFSLVAILGGWTLAVLMLLAGQRLKRRVSRTFCLVVGALECTLMPFGTVLGIFTIIILMRDSVKKLFAAKDFAQSTIPG